MHLPLRNHHPRIRCSGGLRPSHLIICLLVLGTWNLELGTSAANAATVTFRTSHFFGTALNRAISVTLRSQGQQSASNLVFGVPTTLQPTNGVASCTLLAATYNVNFAGINKTFTMPVPDTTNSYEAIDLINQGVSQDQPYPALAAGTNVNLTTNYAAGQPVITVGLTNIPSLGDITNVVQAATNALGTAAYSATGDFDPSGAANAASNSLVAQVNGKLDVNANAVSSTIATNALNITGTSPVITPVSTNTVAAVGQQGSAIDSSGNRYVFNTATIYSPTLTNTIFQTGIDTNLYNHYGDGDLYGQFLYVPVQSWNGLCENNSNASIAVIDKSTLLETNMILVTNLMSEISAVTVDPFTGRLFAFSFCNGASGWIYDIDATGTNLTASGVLSLDKTVNSIQGAQFITNRIYLSGGGQPYGEIDVLDPTTGYVARNYYSGFVGEPEGLELDRSTGVLGWNIYGESRVLFHFSQMSTNVAINSVGTFLLKSPPAVSLPVNVPRHGGVWSGLIYSYDFDEGQSFLAHDLSTNQADAAVQSSLAWASGGIAGGCYNIAGTNRITRLGRGSADGLTNLSLMTWINSTNWTGANQTFAANHAASTDGEYLLGATGTNDIVQWFVINTNSSRVTMYATNSSSLYDGNWHMVVGTYDSAASNLSVYIDGSLISTGTQSGPIKSSGGATIGSYGGGTGDYFSGKIDEASLWSRTLSASEVLGLWKSFRSAAMLSTNGNGSGLTNLNASQLSSGTVPLARLPSNITASNITFSTAGAINLISGGTANFYWDHSGGDLFGFDTTLKLDQGLIFNGGSISGAPITNFVKSVAESDSLLLHTNGNGTGLSGVNTNNASQLSSGTVSTARLGSGTANSTTFLRGDNTWATPAGGSATYTNASITITNGSDFLRITNDGAGLTSIFDADNNRINLNSANHTGSIEGSGGATLYASANAGMQVDPTHYLELDGTTKTLTLHGGGDVDLGSGTLTIGGLNLSGTFDVTTGVFTNAYFPNITANSPVYVDGNHQLMAAPFDQLFGDWSVGSSTSALTGYPAAPTAKASGSSVAGTAGTPPAILYVTPAAQYGTNMIYDGTDYLPSTNGGSAGFDVMLTNSTAVNFRVGFFHQGNPTSFPTNRIPTAFTFAMFFANSESNNVKLATCNGSAITYTDTGITVDALTNKTALTLSMTSSNVIGQIGSTYVTNSSNIPTNSLDKMVTIATWDTSAKGVNIYHAYHRWNP